MKFTERDLVLLTNACETSKNIKFEKGKIQSVITSNKSGIFEFKLDTEIPEEFAIYDLEEFLNYHDLFDQPEITLKGDRIFFKDKKLQSEYQTADKSILITPKPDHMKKLKELKYDYSFLIKADEVREINKLLKKTKLPDVAIEIKNGLFNFKLFSRLDKSQPSISFNFENNGQSKTNRYFNIFTKQHFKTLLFDDYFVEVSNKKVMKFESRNRELVYWFPLEETSEFDSSKGVNSNA